MDTSDNSRYVLVICHACHARLHPRRELVGKRVRCPDCGVAVRVVERAEEVVPVASAASSPGEYRMADVGVIDIDQPRTFLLLCPTCRARMQPRVEWVGKRVRCPDCGKPVEVTPPPEAIPVKPLRPPGEYGVGAEPAPRPDFNPQALPATRVMDPEPPPPPAPRWWFVSGVLNFPWQADSIPRWLILSLMALVTDLASTVLWATLPMVSGDHNYGTAMMTPAVLGLAIILWTITLFYASNCAFSVIRDTAAGNREIVDWGDGDWTDGVWRSAFILLPGIVAASAGLGAVRLASLIDSDFAGLAALLATVLVYPIVLLSVLDGGSLFTWVTGTVLAGLWHYTRGWLVFYVQSCALVGVYIGLRVLGVVFAPYPSLLVTAPLWAALVLILARLLGRLAHRAAEVMEERQSKQSDANEN